MSDIIQSTHKECITRLKDLTRLVEKIDQASLGIDAQSRNDLHDLRCKVISEIHFEQQRLGLE